MKPSKTLLLLGLLAGCSAPSGGGDASIDVVSSGDAVAPNVDGSSMMPSGAASVEGCVLASSCARSLGIEDRFTPLADVRSCMLLTQLARLGSAPPYLATVVRCTAAGAASNCAEFERCLSGGAPQRTCARPGGACFGSKGVYCVPTATGATSIAMQDCAALAVGAVCTEGVCVTTSNCTAEEGTCTGTTAVQCLGGTPFAFDCAQMINGGRCAVRGGKAVCVPPADPCASGASRCEGSVAITCSSRSGGLPYLDSQLDCANVLGGLTCGNEMDLPCRLGGNLPLASCEGDNVVVVQQQRRTVVACSSLGLRTCVMTSGRPLCVP